MDKPVINLSDRRAERDPVVAEKTLVEQYGVTPEQVKLMERFAGISPQQQLATQHAVEDVTAGQIETALGRLKNRETASLPEPVERAFDAYWAAFFRGSFFDKMPRLRALVREVYAQGYADGHQGVGHATLAVDEKARRG
jgi:hypothetical protein